MKDKKGEVVRILIDITTSIDKNIIHKKIESSFDEKGNLKLAEIKYFQSEIENTKGKFKNMPRLVAGFDPNTLRNLCDDVLINKKQQQNNPVQLMLLDEMQHQLIYMLEASRRMNGDSHIVTTQLKKAFDSIKDILDKKESLRTREYKSKASDDKTYHLLNY